MTSRKPRLVPGVGNREKRLDGPRPGFEERRCALLRCRRLFWVRAWVKDLTCCKPHSHEILRTGRARNRLAARLLEYMADHDVSFASIGRQIGIGGEGLSHWSKTKNTALKEETLIRLAELLGIPYDQALGESGGMTAKDRRADAVAKNRERSPKPGSDAFRERQRKASATRKREGWRPTPEQVEKAMEARAATGAHERTGERIRAWSLTWPGNAIVRLNGYLLRTPNPNKATIYRWADQTSATVGTPRLAVLALWRKYLQDRGLSGQGGRRLLEERHELVERAHADWPRDSSGRLRRGFWPDAAARVSLAEGVSDDPLTAEVLRQWFLQHRPRCTASYADGTTAAP